MFCGLIHGIFKGWIFLIQCVKFSAQFIISVHILGFLQLLCALDGVRLVFGPPLGNLAVGLGQCPLHLGFGFLLLLILFPQQVTVVAGGLQGVGQGVLGLKQPKSVQCKFMF